MRIRNTWYTGREVGDISGGVFGCSPITSFSQNVGLVAMTKVVNRFTIMFGALTLIIAGLFPPVGAFFSTLPDCALGGCTVAGVFVVSVILSLAIPKKVKMQSVDALTPDTINKEETVKK